MTEVVGGGSLDGWLTGVSMRRACPGELILTVTIRRVQGFINAMYNYKKLFLFLYVCIMYVSVCIVLYV